MSRVYEVAELNGGYSPDLDPVHPGFKMAPKCVPFSMAPPLEPQASRPSLTPDSVFAFVGVNLRPDCNSGRLRS
jgi:hypothetical protein